jgi:hypothetical protein
MNPEQFNDWIYYYSFESGMSQHYYQIVAGWLWFLDIVARWGTLALASLAIASEYRAKKSGRAQEREVPSASGTVTSKQGFWNWCRRMIVTIAVLNHPEWPRGLRFTVWSAIFAAIVALVPLQEWRAHQLSLLDEWADVGADAEGMALDLKEGKPPKPDYSERSQKLLDKIAKIERQEVFEVPLLPWYCQVCEEIRRGGFFSGRRVYIDKILEPDSAKPQAQAQPAVNLASDGR